MQRRIELKNVEAAHLIGLAYYLDLIADSPYYDLLPADRRFEHVTAQGVFRPFLKKHYDDAWVLVESRLQLRRPVPASI